jgi:predicted regulator of Ras-like GTPase activity (Roadblock/LC7/MglB family)
MSMTGYSLTVEQGCAIESAMCELEVQAEAETVLCIDCSGAILGQAGTLEGHILDTVSALSAGSFAATHELSRVLGEGGFEAVHHQGHKKGIYIHSVAEEFRIVVVFAKPTTIGLVKLYAAKTIKEITPLLMHVINQGLAPMGQESVTFDLDPNAVPFSEAEAQRATTSN